MVNKLTLPTSLVYRDPGGMYFPDKAFLTFITTLDFVSAKT